MAETYLIASSDFATYRQLTGHLLNSYDGRVKPYVLESQKADFREVFTREFYNEIIEVADSGVDSSNGKLTKVNYDLLLPYIKPVLVYFTWGRLLEENQETVTVNSVVQKTNQFSTPSTNNKVTARINRAQSMAQMYIRDMIDFMEDNRNDYSSYFNNISKADTNRGSIRITGIDNTYHNEYYDQNRYNEYRDY